MIGGGTLLLTGRNTYKTRRIMLLYCVLSIASFTLGFFGIMMLTIFRYAWIYVVTILCFLNFFFTFFLLALENNNYKIKYYYSKSRFKEEYEGVLSKYKIDDIRHKKNIKRYTKDYFYQYGLIEEKDNYFRSLIFDCWLEKQASVKYENCVGEEKLYHFLFGLFLISNKKGIYKKSFENLAKVYNREEFISLLDNCEYIKESFKDKCVSMYDCPSFISDEFLDNNYLELFYVIEGVIGLISTEEFGTLMYNEKYYYSDNKRIAYVIEEYDGLFDVIEKDIYMDTNVNLRMGISSKEEAIEFINSVLADRRD